MENKIAEIKSYIRDLNLDVLMHSHDFKIDINRRFCNNTMKFLMPSRKLIKEITKIGGVLVGSRAIRCYSIGSMPMLDRSSSDWDFVVTKSQAFKICEHFDIEHIPEIDKVISVQNQRFWRHPDYSSSYRVGAVDVQMIIKDELPDYNEIDGVRISNFSSNISEKIALIDSLTANSDEVEKHIADMTQLIIKFNCLK